MRPRFEALLAKLGIADDVMRLGYVSEAELGWLYRHCLALVYPTFWEGFGLPLVEAMIQGAAVISSNVSSIPEIVADAGSLIDPHDADALARAMRDPLASPERRRAPPAFPGRKPPARGPRSTARRSRARVMRRTRASRLSRFRSSPRRAGARHP
jgi:glycosyltransferase involved in cell wall biosynthesis